MGGALRALWVLRILVACRVSVLSVLAGTLLFLGSTQARDLFADVTFGALPGGLECWGLWLLFFVYLVLIWAFPAHYAARLMLYSDAWMFSCRVRAQIPRHKVPEIKKDLKGWIDWIPRLIAVVPFVAVLIGLWKAHQVVALTPALTPAREAATQIYVLGGLDILFAVIFVCFLWGRRRFLASRMSDKTSWALAAFYVVVISTLFLASLFRPFFPADIAPRANIVPLLFGSFLFIATFLAWAGQKICVPLLTLSILAALGATALNRHFNDVRTLASAPDHFANRQIDIEVAAAKWKAANCDPRGCPPAVIIALEGGGSRAAFAAATAVGTLLDHARDLPDAKDRGIAPARRIFAISGVSGGAFAAVTIRTALSDSLGRRQGTPPCIRSTDDWFGHAPYEVRSSWRACLQALVAGDYLTPAFVGLAIRDNFSPPNPLSGGSLLFSDDRAALVERAWERHYDYVVRGDFPTFLGQLLQDLRGEVAPQRDSGLRRRFGFVWENMESAPDGAWLPLLLLNSTSVGTGTRIIASDLISTRAAPPTHGHAAGRFPIYPAAFDVFEMLSKPCPEGQVQGQSCAAAYAGTADLPDSRAGPDIRLSTAAMLSARFPIISPAGILRAQGDGAIGDRVVDGGYFENAGLTTAMDVARELPRLGIVPVVLWVQNGPRADAADPKPSEPSSRASDRKKLLSPVPPRGASTPELTSADPEGIERLLGVVVTPLVALTETRDGHGSEEAAVAQRELWQMNEDVEPDDSRQIGSSYFVFGMFEHPIFASDGAWTPSQGLCESLAREWRPGLDQMSEVSLSWWLSQSVQTELDSQICDQRNRKTLTDLARRLSQRCPDKRRDPSSAELSATLAQVSSQPCQE
jgi:hypothetical protein